MTVGEVLDRLKAGEKMKEIAEGVGLSPSTIQRNLKSLGYEFDNSTKVWNWAGEGEEPHHINVLDKVKKANVKRSSSKNESNVNNDTHSVHIGTEHISQPVHIQFTQSEIGILKQMISQWSEVRPPGASPSGGENAPSEEVITPLHERIKGLPQLKPTEEKRGTIVVDPSILQSLDEFARRERVDKSDVIHLALLDFIQKYS